MLGDGIKKLGFGLMRLPQKDGRTDIEQVKAMVDRFMEAGFTYFDTAWAYEGSEEAMKEALVDRYPRESYTVATKLAAWIGCKSKEDAVAQFETSLKRSGLEYFDFYLLHNMGQGRTKMFDDFDCWSFIKEMKAAGKIKHIGFSFHATPEELEEILKAHPEVEFVQLQINYADWESPSIQSRAVYEVVRKYNKPIVVMEPVKGGMLANPPQQIKDVFAAADPNASAASWAIRFVADQEGIMTVLSGMSTLEQMEDNISYMKDFTHLSDDQRKVLDEARDIMSKIPLVPCTSCNYCTKVCPMGIGVPESFSCMNNLTLYNNVAAAKEQLGWFLDRSGRKYSSECVQCGQCEEVCPQHISIREELEKVTAKLVD